MPKPSHQNLFHLTKEQDNIKQTCENSILAAVLNTNFLAIAITNNQGILIEVSKGFCKLLGYKKKELTGKSYTRFFPEKIKTLETDAPAIVALPKGIAKWVMQKNNGTLLVGIKNIKSRADLYNGTVTIVSKPGKGYELKVVLSSNSYINRPEILEEMPAL